MSANGEERGRLKAGCGSYTLTGYTPSIVVDGPGRAYVSDPIGSSEGTKLANGRYSMTVRGSPLTGRKNEPTAIRVLAQAMALRDGLTPTISDVRPDDGRGEDAIFSWCNKIRIVQVVTVPSSPQYQREVGKGVSTIEFSIEQGADFLRDAIFKKKSKYAAAHRRSMILALDARHAGILTHDDILSSLKSRYPEAVNAGFAEIWIVCAIPPRCVRLISSEEVDSA